MRILGALPLVLSLVVIPACGGSDASPPLGDPSNDDDAGADALPDTLQEASPDTGEEGDAGPDAASEAGDDDAGETGEDAAPPDSGPDADPNCGTPAECAALAEENAADTLAAIVDDDVALKNFLRDVPKGGDLHHHLSGGVYAETYLDWARSEGGYCITTSTLSSTWTCGSGTAAIPSPGDSLYQQIIRAWSMEGFVPSGSESGHDHFFATFSKFGAISGTHHGEMVADILKRAASENELYVEPMLTANTTAQNLGQDLWSANHSGTTLAVAHLPAFYAELMASSGMPAAISRVTSRVQDSDSEARQIMGCSGSQPTPACAVGVKYAAYISRSGHTAGVFAQMVAAFEAAIQEPRLVAINLVGPEDSTGALSRYDVEMEMLGFLHDTYRVTGKSPLRVTLHAGELAPTYMPASYNITTVDHIRKAINIARAERIGHGIDIMLQADAEGLLADMSQKKVLVEICLSSNVQILEVSGADHPLATYIDRGVPVALATDDQGVSRSSMAGEYLLAVRDQQLDYRRLKTMARASLEYSFLPGASLWAGIAQVEPVAACAITPTSYLGDDPPSADCAAYLSTSERAKYQWELERRFRMFEATQ